LLLGPVGAGFGHVRAILLGRAPHFFQRQAQADQRRPHARSTDRNPVLTQKPVAELDNCCIRLRLHLLPDCHVMLL
jgi:hypothetical protein